nr:MAG TPA: hypothetical protein [Caudoviricetes sp.]
MLNISIYEMNSLSFQGERFLLRKYLLSCDV